MALGQGHLLNVKENPVKTKAKYILLRADRLHRELVQKPEKAKQQKKDLDERMQTVLAVLLAPFALLVVLFLIWYCLVSSRVYLGFATKESWGTTSNPFAAQRGSQAVDL